MEGRRWKDGNGREGMEGLEGGEEEKGGERGMGKGGEREKSWLLGG